MSPLSSFLVAGARVGVIGSRDFECPSLVEAFVMDLPGCVVVSGSNLEAFENGASLNSCGGIVDVTAVRAARDSGLPFDEFSADWRRYGRGAGLVRNRPLVASVSVLVVFVNDPSSPSRGSADAMKLAKAVGIPVFVFGPDGSELKKKGKPLQQLNLF